MGANVSKMTFPPTARVAGAALAKQRAILRDDDGQVAVHGSGHRGEEAVHGGERAATERRAPHLSRQ